MTESGFVAELFKLYEALVADNRAICPVNVSDGTERYEFDTATNKLVWIFSRNGITWAGK